MEKGAGVKPKRCYEKFGKTYGCGDIRGCSGTRRGALMPGLVQCPQCIAGASSPPAMAGLKQARVHPDTAW